MIPFGIDQVGARARRAVTATALMFVLASPAFAQAHPEPGSVTVTVSNNEGRRIPAAIVTLRGSNAIRTLRTDLRGAASQSGLAPGVYVAAVTAAGYAPLGGRTIEVRSSQTTDIEFELDRSSSSLVVLGRVTTHGGETLSTSSAPSQSLQAQQYAAAAGTDVAQLIAQDAVSVTVIRPAGGNPAAPAVVALRGPDPTETLVDIDGHSVNSGGTGAFDLSLVDPSELEGVQLVYGIAPSSLVGPNTIDGAINVRTLEPTVQPAGLVRIAAGSFGTFGETLQATGSAARLGYALSLHRTTSQGEVNDQQVLTVDGDTDIVGSSISGSTGLLKLRYDVPSSDSYVALALRDQSEYRDLSAALTSVAPPSPGPTAYNSFAGSSLAAHNGSIGLDVHVPLGARDGAGQYPMSMLFSHLTSLGDQSVDGPASSTTPYLFNTHDVLADDTLQIDRPLANGVLSLKLGLRTEHLDTQTLIAGTPDQAHARRPGIITLDDEPSGPSSLPTLSQTERSAVLRYAFDTTPKLHYSGALYLSDFTSFGTSVDPRVGLVWTPTADTAVRGSIGSTFQSPQLPELYVPTVLPPADSDGFINVGNPNLKADHATDFDLGIAQLVNAAQRAQIDLDLYQTNLRTPAVRFFPAVTCLPPAPPTTACESFPINAGGAVYRGIEFRAQRAIGTATLLRFAYSVNSSFATSVSPAFQDGTIVPGEQSQGVPLHRGVLSVQRDAGAVFGYDAGIDYEDGDNELNRPAYLTAHAGITWHLKGFDLGLYGTNLTNVYDDRFTLAGQGQPYGGVDGPLPTDAYSLQGRAFSFVISRRY
jgi:outer membrane receptor protein involved in Fe transport